MSDFAPLTALGAYAPRIDHHAGVTLTEVTDTQITSYAARLGQEKAAAEALAQAIGAAPPSPGRAAGTPAALWMAPEQWLVLGAASNTPAASTTDQTDAWVRFDLSGPGIASVLERLSPLDTATWTGGEASRTPIEHLGCFVCCVTPAHFMVLGPRSSAGSLHHALHTALLSAL